jgi:23S rRNA (guanosine2251-2'-O)-methyltransferase
MEKQNQIFGIRAVIEAVQSGKEIDKVFVQKESGSPLMKELFTVLK